MIYGGAHRVRRFVRVLPSSVLTDIVVAAGDGLVTIDGQQPGVSAVIEGETWNVHPVIPEGFLYSQRSVITNLNATYRVDNQITLGGTFEFFDGTAYRYTPGTQTGVASFDYTVLDYDGLGNNTSATHSINVV